MEFRSKRHRNVRALAIRSLGFNSVLIALAFASVETVWPIFLHEFFPSSSAVGFVTAILAVSLIISLAALFPLFRKFSAKSLLFFALSANAIVISLFALVKSPIIFFILAIINTAFVAIRTQSFGILVRHNSSLKTINNNENLIYLLANIGWIVGPLVAGFFAQELSVQAVLMLASLFLLLSVYSVTFSTKALKREGKEEVKHVQFIKNFRSFFTDKKRILSYILSGGLEVWWSLPYIFIPLEIIKQGLPIKTVGIFLFALCIPLLVVEYIMNRRQKANLQKLIGSGYLFAFLCGVGAALSGEIYVMLGCFVVASFGLGLVEPTVESLFFSSVNKEQAKRYYGSFFTSKTIGGFFGKLVIAILLLFLPLQASILLVAAIMLVLASIAFFVKTNHKHIHHKRKHGTI